MRLSQNMGIGTDSSEFVERVAEAIEISVADVDDLRNMVSYKLYFGSKINEKGEEYSLIDQLDSGKYTDSGVM